MVIGVLSDTHNNYQGILKAVKIFSNKGVETIIHCGDLTDPDHLWYFNGFPLIYVYGNMDIMTGALRNNILSMDKNNIATSFYSGKLDGLDIAVIHGQNLEHITHLIDSGKYDFIFYGHTHKAKEYLVGKTRVLNPGALGGRIYAEPTILVIDLDKKITEFLPV